CWPSGARASSGRALLAAPARGLVGPNGAQPVRAVATETVRPRWRPVEIEPPGGADGCSLRDTAGFVPLARLIVAGEHRQPWKISAPVIRTARLWSTGRSSRAWWIGASREAGEFLISRMTYGRRCSWLSWS